MAQFKQTAEDIRRNLINNLSWQTATQDDYQVAHAIQQGRERDCYLRSQRGGSVGRVLALSETDWTNGSGCYHPIPALKMIAASAQKTMTQEVYCLWEYGHPAERWSPDVEERIVKAIKRLVGEVEGGIFAGERR